jgi:hypothetical protein
MTSQEIPQSPASNTKQWVNDTKITILSETIHKQLLTDKKRAAEDAGDDIPTTSLYNENNQSTLHEERTPQRIRFNLIRLRNATNNTPKLAQFKSFANAPRQADQTISFLQYLASKQYLSPISTIKQINNIDAHMIQQYFKSYYKEQHILLVDTFT